jgi:hypothetical protein
MATGGGYGTAVEHGLDKAREDAPAIREQTCTANCETRKIRQWVLRTMTDARRDAKRLGEEGSAVAPTWLPSSTSSNGGKIADTAAQWATKRPPRAMRSASL